MGTLVGFLEDQEMEATFSLIALVFLSLCHQSHQCKSTPDASEINQGGSPSPSSQDFWSFEGSIFKAKPEYLTPRGVKIHWMNFLEGDDVRDGTAFKMTTKSNDIHESNFKISMNLTAEEFDQSITMHPKILQRFSRDKTTEEIEKIKNFRLALGFIIGTDISGGSTQGLWSYGPNDEKAWADRFAVFYKMVPMILEDQNVLGIISCLKASAAVKHLYLFMNAIEALKDLFLFPAMKLSLRWQTKKVALGTKYLMVLKITQVEVNTTWMTLMVRTVLLVPIGHEMLEMMN